MKKILIFFILFISTNSYCQIPAPPSPQIFSVIDDNNDGYASFDINYYLNTFLRNLALTEHNYDLSGYTITLHSNYSDTVTGSNPIQSPYINIVAYLQECYVKFNYLGTGTQYNESDLLYYYGSVFLQCVDPNADFDNDTVSNSNEDLNGNKILNDNDTDSDGKINFKDNDDDNDSVLTINEDYNGNGNPTDDDLNTNGIPDYLDNTVTGVLTNENFSLNDFKVYPNPTTDYINFESKFPFDLKIYDEKGNLVLDKQNTSNQVNISNLSTGMYLVKIDCNGIYLSKKIVKK